MDPCELCELLGRTCRECRVLPDDSAETLVDDLDTETDRLNEMEHFTCG